MASPVDLVQCASNKSGENVSDFSDFDPDDNTSEEYNPETSETSTEGKKLHFFN